MLQNRKIKIQRKNNVLQYHPSKLLLYTCISILKNTEHYQKAESSFSSIIPPLLK